MLDSDPTDKHLKTKQVTLFKNTQISYKGSMSTLAASDNGLLGDLSTKNWITANGERMAIYCHFVRRWQGVGAQPWQGDQRGWNPFARTPIRDKGRSILYIHRVALLPLNLRTVYEQSEETSKCAYLCFYLVGRSNSRDKSYSNRVMCRV